MWNLSAVCLFSTSIASFPFLTLTAFDHAYDSSSFLFKQRQEITKLDVLLSHISPVYRKPKSSLRNLSCLVCLPCLPRLKKKREILRVLFLSPPILALRCSWFQFFEIVAKLTSLQADFDKQYPLTLRSVSHCRQCAATVEHPLNSALNLHALHGHGSKPSICHGLVFSLIKFTLHVSSTPSCEWITFFLAVSSSFFPRVKRTYVCLCRPGSTSLSYGSVLVGGMPIHGPVTSPPWHLFFAPPPLSSVHICLFCYLSFFSSSFSLFSLSFSALLKAPESAETWGSEEEKEGQGSLPSHSFFLSDKTHLFPFLLFWGINLCRVFNFIPKFIL